jgi:DNA-binding FrmR family transcriptional regulator
MAKIKFASLVEAKVLKDLRAYSAATDRSISSLVSEALAEYLARVAVRPAFRSAMEEVVSEHDELLKRLAK